MKKSFLVFGILLIPAFLSAQAHSFKTISKNLPGTVVPGFSHITIGCSSPLKSSQVKILPFRQVPNLVPGRIRSGLNVITDIHGAPVYMERPVHPLKSALSSEEELFAFLEETREVTGIDNPQESFRIEELATDELGITHIMGIQQYRGIVIYGSQFGFHISSDKVRLTGRIRCIRGAVDTSPALLAGEAEAIAAADLRKETVCKDLSEKEKQILGYREPLTRLVIYETEQGEPVLAYDIEIRPNFLEVWKYFIHAETGEIIRKYNGTASDGPATANAYDLNGILRTIDTYLENGTYYLMNISENMFNASRGEGIILTLDANHSSTNNLNYREVTSQNNTWNMPAAVSAHYNATRTYEYLQTTFGRNSINGQGGNILSLVNVAEDDGSSMENAFWNGKAAFYGNGGTSFKSLAGALDVTAHELGHGVVSNTANLEYYGQSGAINETFADIFGSMVDREDWLIGEDITRPGFSPSGALRNMEDPHNRGREGDEYWQPRHVSEMYLGSGDNAGVHINNGIGNHAYYLFSTAVSKDKAEQVFYRALTRYLTTTSKFLDFRIAVIQSAKDLYGETSIEAAEAAEAFSKVGIYEEEPVEEQQDYNINPGQEYLLCYNTYRMDSNTLYQSFADGTGFVPLTKTPIKGKASVTDDGKFAVFVSTDHKIRLLDLTSRQESVIQEDPFWDNVVLSKDGKRLAAISNEIDTAVYVFDFDIQQWAKFNLYNPTTSHYGTNAGGVLFADAIEFDHSGQFLMYDAYNQLNSSAFEDIGYWDIGFIQVWDNRTSDFSDGTISKLFGSLPEKISVGNAVFSKNSANIIAFDYLDEASDEYAILGLDLESGDVGIIFENSILGFPSFSKDDRRLAFSAKTTSDDEVVGMISLASNKISSSGNASILVEDAKWPVFFSTGSRTLGLPPAANFSVDLKSGNAPLNVRFLDLSVNVPTAWEWSFPGGNPSSSTLQNPAITYPSEGIYPVSLKVTNSFGENTATKSSYITVSPSTGILDHSIGSVTFYPNPFSSHLTLSSSGDFCAGLFGLQGEKIWEWSDTERVNLSHLTKGIYILEIKTGNKVSRNKVVKQ